MKKAVYYLGLLLVLNSCSKGEGPAFPFEHLDSSKTGITFSNQLIDTDSFNIMQYLYYYNGGGVAAGDINNDGWVDLFFTGNQVSDALYLNQKKIQCYVVQEMTRSSQVYIIFLCEFG